jgi:hypothetical protein
MANYVYIENGDVKEAYDILPTNWRNISYLPGLSEEEMLNIGWYKVKHNIPSEFNPPYTQIQSEGYEITDNSVIQHYKIVINNGE